MTKINFNQLVKDSASHVENKQFNKTLFVPQKNKSYIVTLDLNNIEEIIKKSPKTGKEYEAKRFSNILVDNTTKNWDMFNSTYDLVLELVAEVKPTNTKLPVLVVTNEQGYVTEISLYEAQSNNDNVIIDSIDVDDDVIGN